MRLRLLIASTALLLAACDIPGLRPDARIAMRESKIEDQAMPSTDKERKAAENRKADDSGKKPAAAGKKSS